MDAEKELKEISEDVAKVFKSYKEEAKEKLSLWSKRILELRAARLSDNVEKAKEAEKSEKYAWDAIFVIYAQYSKSVEKDAWNIAERLLKLTRNVLLSY